MKFLIIFIVVILVFLLLRVSIYIKYEEKFEIWLKLTRLFNFKVNISKILKKYIKLDKIKIDRKLIRNELTISNYLIKDLLKRINIENLTIIEYTNILSDRFILGIPFTMYYMNIILKDNLEKYFKSIENSYYSLNLINNGSNYIKAEIDLNIRIFELIVYFIKNFKFIFRRKVNDRT